MIAYASYCQRDQRGRPIAGYINICPQMLADDNYDEEKIYWVRVAFVPVYYYITVTLFPFVEYLVTSPVNQLISQSICLLKIGSCHGWNERG